MNTRIIFISLALVTILHLLPNPACAESNRIEKARREMVELQLKGRDIADPGVLKVMAEVPREEFVPKSLLHVAHNDHPLPIGEGQTISQPYIVALMTQVLKLKPTDRALEIGTGSGYQAAVLSKLVKDVYTIEIKEKLGLAASARLKRLGYNNVHVRIGDGYYGWKEHAPYNAIMVTAAASFIPPLLIKQLADGGRLVIPLGSPKYYQTLTLVTKKGEKIETEHITNVRFVPMTGRAFGVDRHSERSEESH